MKTLIKGSGLGITLRSNTILTTLMAAGVVAGAIVPSYAQISNTATVSGEGPGGDPADPSDDITDSSGPVTVDVAPVTPGITVVKTITSTPADPAGYVAGETITYTYTVTNSGGSYLRDVSLSDTHEAPGFTQPVFAGAPLTDNNTVTDSTDADNSDNAWDLLAPGDVLNYVASYTVTAADIAGNGFDGDGEIDNTVTAISSATVGGVTTSPSDTDTAAAPLLAAPSLSLVKSANPTTGVVAGDTVVYTYVVTNDGTVPISNISISDIHQDGQGVGITFDSTTGAIGTGDNEWSVAETTPATSGPANADVAGDGVFDTIGVGGVVTFTYNHIVTQAEVDAQ